MSINFISFKFCFIVIFVLLVLVLSVLFLVVLISLPPRFSMQSLSRCLDALTLSLIVPSPIIILLLESFFTSALADSFPLEFEWKEVPGTLLSILTDLNPLLTVPRASVTIGIIVTFTIYSFFTYLTRSKYLSLLSHCCNFSLWSTGTAKSTIPRVLSFLSIMRGSGRLAKIRWSVCISKPQRSLCVSFFRTDSGLRIYHLFVWFKFNYLHNSQCIILPTQSCLVLYSFCANLLHSLFLWLIVPFLSPHNLHLMFCCVLSILTLVWLVLTPLFCSSIRRDSVSLLMFPFLSHIHIFSRVMSLISC